MVRKSIQGKNVLVTGADGFIGSHLVEKFVEHGANIRALALYNSFNNRGWLEDVQCLNEIEVVCGDIRDPDFTRKISRDMDLIVHLAALIAIPYSYVAPSSYVHTNVVGTMNVIQAALENNVERILHTSTSEVYGTANYVPIDELHPMQPQSPYSASKIAADAFAESFYRCFDLPLTIVRPFNTYGPRQSARAVIPTVITRILTGDEEIILGNIHPTRDFSYVEDTCNAFLELAGCDEAIGTVVNVGSNREISIYDLVMLIKEIMKSDAVIKTEDQRIRPEKSEVERLRCDHSRLVKLTNIQPGISLREGLTRTIDWFSDPGNLKKYKADIYNV